MNLVLVAIINGISIGSTYALIGLGIVLIYRTTGAFNLAHGELMLLGAYVLANWQAAKDGPFLVGLLLSLAVTAAFAILCYAIVLRWTVGLPTWVGFVVTLVLAGMINAGLALKYGANSLTLTIPGLPTGAVRILGSRFASATLIIAFIGLAITVATVAVLRWTRIGVQVRAAGQAPLLASQGGINVRRLYVGSWAVAGILAAVAGVLYGSTTAVDSTMPAVALVAIPGIVLGGLDSVEGAWIGGVAIGIVQGFVSVYLGGQYLNPVTWALLLVLLLIRPACSGPLRW